MIGLLSAVALLGMSVWILADWWFSPKQPRFRVRIASDPLARLRTMLIEADLEDWHARYVVLASLGLALVCGAIVYQALGWLIGSRCNGRGGLGTGALCVASTGRASNDAAGAAC